MTGSAGPAGELAARIARHGSVGFDEFVEVALYHPDGGFFASGGGAGLTSCFFAQAAAARQNNATTETRTVAFMANPSFFSWTSG